MAAAPSMLGVLFVCLGNICRSPTGEAVFRHHVEAQQLGHLIHIDSAGILGSHAGVHPDARMRAAAAERGYRLESVARQVTASDLRNFLLVVAMDHENYRDLVHLKKTEPTNIRMLGSFLAGFESQTQAPVVPDPYYGGADGFERVLDIIEDACPKILARLVATHESLRGVNCHGGGA